MWFVSGPFFVVFVSDTLYHVTFDRGLETALHGIDDGISDFNVISPFQSIIFGDAARKEYHIVIHA